MEIVHLLSLLFLFATCTKASDRSIFRSKCHGQCGEGEGDCDKDNDCLPGFICKSEGLLGLANDYCTADIRKWQCGKFPKWLQKTYEINGTDFCKAQWDDIFFSSQPNCDHGILPTVAFYDRSDDQFVADPLCTINMNEAEDGVFGNLCPEVESILNSDNEEVWIVYLVHGFAGYSTTPLWYPHHGVGLSKRFKQKGRKIIVGEVYWKEGAEAIFDKILPPGLVHKIISMTIGRSLPEERAYLESVAERKNQPYCPGIFAEAGCSHVAFSLWFLPKIWAENANGNKCMAKMKCPDEEAAMRNHKSCNMNRGHGLEVGLLSDTPSQGNRGIYWLDTLEVETSACHFTTMDIAQDALNAMESGWNDLWSINLSDYIGK